MRWRDLDWLRGLAVVFMIEVHGFDAWLRPELRAGEAWWWISHLGGFAAPMFLFIAGLTLAWQVGPRLARGEDAAALRLGLVRRGLEVVAWGYLFRLALIAVAGNPLEGLFKVDILQQIGFSLALTGALVGRRMALRAGLAFALLCALTPLVTALPLPPPAWRPLTSFVTGERPLAYFPAFPWMGYTLAGAWAGAIIGDPARPEAGRRLLYLVIGGAALAYLSRQVLHPYVAARFSDPDPNHGPGAVTRMGYRLGVCLALPGVARAVVRALRVPWGPVTQMGRTSLLLYVVHVPIVYGPATRFWRKGLDLAQASGALIGLFALMVALSLARTRWPHRFRVPWPGRAPATRSAA